MIMDALERIIRSERKQKYKYLKKLIKARDMASKHINSNIRLSQLNTFVSECSIDVDGYFTGNLAKLIVDHQKRIVNGKLRPPPPPSQSVRVDKDLLV